MRLASGAVPRPWVLGGRIDPPGQTRLFLLTLHPN